MKKVLFFLFLITAAVAGYCSPELQDSIGVVGVQIGNLFKKIGLDTAVAQMLVAVLAATTFRCIQLLLQKLPTKWKWVNNKLTLGIVNRILAALFGKTTMYYNSQVKMPKRIAAKLPAPDQYTVNQQLKKDAAKYFSGKGGVLTAFEDAMKELK